MIDKFKKPLSITSQFSFCGLPFRLDTYSGCEYNCKYCYAHRRNGNFGSSIIKAADPNLIIKRFKSAFYNQTNSTGLVSEVIRHRMPLHFGGMSDPFQPLEKSLQISRKILEFLKIINYPLVISTKSNLLSNDAYLNILRDYKNLIVQMSFSSLDQKITDIIEPNCPPPSERLKTLDLLSKNRILTSIRWQPYIPTLSESPGDFIKTVSNLGISHLTIEFLKIPSDNKHFWSDFPNPYNKLRSYYIDHGGIKVGREFVLPPEVKIKTILEVKKHLLREKISFGCAENDLQYLSGTDCCCGVDKYDGFENWNKYQISYAIKKSENGQIKYDLIRNEWKPNGSIDQYLNSKSRKTKRHTHNTIKDYIIDRWENVCSDFNLTKYYNVKDTNTRDENGIRIFVKEDDLGTLS